MNEEDTLILKKKDPDWYISDIHCRRALEYLRSKLLEDGLLTEVTSGQWQLMWEEALEQTTSINEPSPLGPDPEQAKKFLMAQIEARVSRLEERSDSEEEAVMLISNWLLRNNTHYGWPIHQKIEKTLYGTETTPEARPDPTP